MSDPLSGSRQAPRPSLLRRVTARAMASDLAAFVVPGPDVARSRGLDLDAAGLRVAQSPRHASVLVLVGEPLSSSKRAAAVAYAQMPRPRAILAVGTGDVSPLPEPDVAVAAGQEELAAGVMELRRLFEAGAFTSEAAGFDVEEIRLQTEYACPMHPEATSDEPGSCPRCGMDLVPRESTGSAGHDETGHEGGGDHSGGHEGHDDMGFMSMVEMTRGTPRSSDGLQMEWTGAPFGPLFPGLPGGLSLTFTLDGDTVAGVEVPRDALDLTGVPVPDLPDQLAFLDPLSPTAYRVLAMQALEDAAHVQVDEKTALERVGALERERAASHLGWLSGFGRLLGYSWLETRAGKLQVSLVRAADAGYVARLESEVGRLARRVSRTPMLAHRLKGIGTLPDAAETLGPVARAAGLAKDARSEGIYRTLGFEPVAREGDDALARLQTRLAEIEQSLELVRRTGAVSLPEPALVSPSDGNGHATVETSRGAASLGIGLHGGVVTAVELETPSGLHHGLIEAVTKQREVADALLGVASLDLSPWWSAR
jgi:Heavy metal binding domain/Respiratory-chain NADH dehydrogenase, 49 Kd subunit